jgi:hypothetical protein
MPLVRFLRVVYVRDNLSRWPNRVGRTLLLLRKRPLDTIPSTSSYRSAGPPPSFSTNIVIEAVMKPKHLLMICYISFLGPYLQHVISTFNTCSRGLTHWSLTDIGGATILEVPAYHITLPDLPNRWSSSFHLRASPSLRLNIQQLTIDLKKE